MSKRNNISLLGAALLGLACIVLSTSSVRAEGVERPSVPNVPVVVLGLDCPTNQLAGEIVQNSVTLTIASSTATNASLSALIPAEASFVSATGNSVYQESTRTILWSLGAQNPGDRSVTYSMRLSEPLANATPVTSTAEFTSDQTVPVSATCTTLVTAAPRLTLSFDPTTARLLAGGTATITIKLTNSGTEDALNTLVRLSLDAGLVFSGTDRSTQEFPLGTLAAGKYTEIVAMVSARPGTPATKYDLTAQAQADRAVTLTEKIELTVEQATIAPGTELAADVAPPAGLIKPIGQVLGAETELTETGVTFRDWLIIYCATLLITIGTTTLVFYPFPTRKR